MDRQAIVERVISVYYGPSAYDEMGDMHREAICKVIEDTLNAAGYFDLLEAARDMVKEQQSVLNSETCAFKRCRCGGIINLDVRYSDKCVACRMVEILRKAGVEVE